MNSIVKKQKADKASFERHLEALLQNSPGSRYGVNCTDQLPSFPDDIDLVQKECTIKI